jgi:hypothetical protein
MSLLNVADYHIFEDRVEYISGELKQETYAEELFHYLRDVIYNPSKAALDLNCLPEELYEFGNALRYFAECVMETREMTQALSKGDLTAKLPSRGNEIIAPLKSLNASLKHLTWQAQQIAMGDYTQRVAFMGEFSTAFNTMVEQLAERQKKLEDKTHRDGVTQLYNRAFGMLVLDKWLDEKKRFSLIFVDLDNLKYINDEFGHHDGDMYIMNAAKHLRTLSPP